MTALFVWTAWLRLRHSLRVPLCQGGGLRGLCFMTGAVSRTASGRQPQPRPQGDLCLIPGGGHIPSAPSYEALAAFCLKVGGDSPTSRRHWQGAPGRVCRCRNLCSLGWVQAFPKSHVSCSAPVPSSARSASLGPWAVAHHGWHLRGAGHGRRWSLVCRDFRR